VTLDSKRHAVEGLCSVREACEFLSIGKSSLYNLMKKGQLPFVFVGSNRRIPRKALVEFTERILEERQISLSS
jgi:excisionase family DNA binding protein